MTEKQVCHYCHEPITRHEDVSEVYDYDGPGRTYHSHCHDQDIYEHRERGEPLPEDMTLEEMSAR